MSVVSQANGGENDRSPGGRAEGVPSEGRRARRSPDAPLEVNLEHSRWRHFGWALFGLASGALLLWRLGAVGKVLGVLLVLIGAWAGYAFVRTLRNPPGRILVDLKNVTLPEGLCRGREHTFPLADVRHAFFLRRTVPWTRTGPVLVIEVDQRAFAYPRDWFASESDQRRVATVLNRYLGRPIA